jgi:RNA polymerase sigma-70 factor (ECF subfamily)
MSEEQLQILLPELVNRNCKSQEALFHGMSPILLGICCRYIPDRHHAEEVMVNVLLQIFTQIPQFRNEGSLKGWMKRICVNTCITQLRKKEKIDTASLGNDTELEFAEVIEENISPYDMELLENALNSLPVGCKVIFSLFAIEGYSIAEIASLLECSQGNVKSQLSYARKLLSAYLIKYHPEYVPKKVQLNY